MQERFFIHQVEDKGEDVLELIAIMPDDEIMRNVPQHTEGLTESLIMPIEAYVLRPGDKAGPFTYKELKPYAKRTVLLDFKNKRIKVL